MIEDIEKNLKTAESIVREISEYTNKIAISDYRERKILNQTISSLRNTLKIINQAIPELINKVNIVEKKIPGYKESKSLEIVSFKVGERNFEATIPKIDRGKFLEELSISESLIKKIKKKEKDENEVYQEFKAARGYLKLANKIFLESATNLINSGKFVKLKGEIKKANIEVLLETYVAMILLNTSLAFFGGIVLFLALLFFNISLTIPFFTNYSGDLFSRFINFIWLPIALPIATYFLTYIYPSIEKKSISEKIDSELPFAVVHMGAISGSGIEPSQIFKIIGTNKDYPVLRKEIRKLMNQINLYGYDLVTALSNVSKNTPSQKLGELFSGLATTIHSGGELKDFFEKRGETLLTEYRIDREKYSKTAETFMDIYISVVIAAPMILMLLLVIISVSGVGLGFSQGQLTLIIIGVITIINILFLGFLQIKQPTY